MIACLAVFKALSSDVTTGMTTKIVPQGFSRAPRRFMKLKLSLVLSLLGLLPSLCYAQKATSKGAVDLGPKSVWNLPDSNWELWRDIHQKCGGGGGFSAWRSSATKLGIREKRANMAFTNCVATRMRKAGASFEAITFAKQMNGGVYLGSFKEMGKVDIATTVAPMWNDPNVEDSILINGAPKIIHLWERVENIDITRDRLYSVLKRKYPELMMWPMHSLVSMRKLPKGGQRFVFSFILLNGCRACDIAGYANIAFDFDPAGSFMRTALLRLTEYIERIAPQYAPKPKEITVSSVQEFLSAIGSNTTIRVNPGQYVINESLLRNSTNPHVSWASNQFEDEDITVRVGLTIKNVSNLKILGTTDGEKPHFIQPNRSSTVLIFNNTYNLVLDNLLVGHMPNTDECFAGVVAFYDSDKVTISNADFYGSGMVGLELFNAHRVDFVDSMIRECTGLILQVGFDSEEVSFSSSKFINNRAQEIRVFENSSKVSFTNVEISDNGHAEYNSSLFDVWDGCKNVTLTKSRIKNNSIGWFESTEGRLTYDDTNEIDFTQFRKGKSFARSTANTLQAEPAITRSQTGLGDAVTAAKRAASSKRSFDLVGTTWKLYTTNGGLNEWGTYTFLTEGRIQEDEKAGWKLARNKLTITEEYGLIDVIVKGNLMTGGGQLGMNPRPFRMRGNKVQANAASSVGPGQSSLGNWPDLENWTELDRGQKKGALQFSQGGTLLFGGRPVAGVRFKSTVDKIAVSPPAVKGEYAICVTFDQAESVGFLIQLSSRSGKRLALEGPPSVWAAWSASGKHAVISSYYEGDPVLYSINLPAGNVRRFSLNVAKGTEEENYDLDNLTWINNNVFQLQVSVNCNPYTDDNCSGQDRTKVLREYEVRANVVTLQVSSERIR